MATYELLVYNPGDPRKGSQRDDFVKILATPGAIGWLFGRKPKTLRFWGKGTVWRLAPDGERASQSMERRITAMIAARKISAMAVKA